MGRLDVEELEDEAVPLRFEVRDQPRTAPAPAAHAGECMADDSYDGAACCPLGDVERT